MCKISIITVTYNSADLLRNTITSVFEQTYEDYEYIIIDGGSTDETKSIVTPFLYQISKFISEPDKGIYNAMNKGIALAKGDYCMFLNAGDVLYDCDTLSQIVNSFSQKNVDIYIGDAIYYKEGEIGEYFAPQLEKMPFRFCHQAMLFRTELLKNNMYNEEYRLSGDSELLYRLIEKGVNLESLHFPLVRELVGEGATERNLMTSTRELYSIPYVKRNMPAYRIAFNKTKITMYCLLKRLSLIRR